jgi:energy-coupling factor transporter ATP-binding protein EcfA2
MKLLRHGGGQYRTIGIVSADIDLERLTVVFGANGSGKSNLLESIAWSFEDAASNNWTNPRPRPAGSPDEDSVPASINVWFDEWDVGGSSDERIVRALLTHPLTAAALAMQTEPPPEGAPSADWVASNEDLLHTWSEVVAANGEAGSISARRDLAYALLAQASFALPEGVLLVRPEMLDGRVRRAATEIAGALEDTLAARLIHDPLADIARTLDREPVVTGLWNAFEPGGDISIGRDVPELRELLRNVSFVRVDETGIDEARASAAVRRIDPQLLEAAANDLAPRFVRQRGRILIEPETLLPRFAESDGETRALGDLGAGIRRWIEIATVGALRSAEADGPRLWLIDEPEAHLHAAAVRDLRDWLLCINQKGCGIVVATHALELLDLPPEHADVRLLTRREREYSVAAETTNLLASLESYASELGIGRGDALRIAAAVLVVDGAHDRMIIERLYADELTRRRVIILSLRGIHEALALVELEYLIRLGIPLVFLCDNVSRAFLERPNLSREATPEEQKIFTFFRWAKQDPDVSVEIRSHGLPDILFALPDKATRKVVGGRFAGWKTLTGIRGGKKALAAALGVDVVDGRFIERVLSHCDATSRPAAELEQAMQEVFAALDG